MTCRQPLKDHLHRIVDDLDVIFKQLAEAMTTPRNQRSMGEETNVEQLVELFKIKEQELNEGMKIAAQQAERQKVINRLEEEMRKRDEYIIRIRNCLKDSEDMLINAIFQANQKLKSVAEANRRKVSAEELIRYAHRISASNSVAAPLTWQQGDPQRPYPIDVEMWMGWSERAKERLKMEKDFNTMAPLGGPMGSAGPSMMHGGHQFPTGPVIPPMQHEMFMRPPHQTSGIFPPQPMVQSPMGPPRSTGWMSPRSAVHGQNLSPRISARPLTPGGGGGPMQFARQPFPQSVGTLHSMQPSQATIKVENPLIASSADTIEVLSSDSSSSSDSDSQ